jgi:hypothetical protein
MALNKQKATDAVMSEYEFVVSLIRMYRGFQMQAVGFSIVLYTAVLGLIGSALPSTRFTDVASHTTALLSYLIAIVVLAFTVMEVRIRRASLYITHSLLPRLYELLDAPKNAVILEFERAPSQHLTRFQRLFAHSTIFVLLIGLPSLGAAVWHMAGGAIPSDRAHPYIAGAGAVLLTVACIVAATTSARAELRGIPPSTERRAAADA